MSQYPTYDPRANKRSSGGGFGSNSGLGSGGSGFGGGGFGSRGSMGSGANANQGFGNIDQSHAGTFGTGGLLGMGFTGVDTFQTGVNQAGQPQFGVGRFNERGHWEEGTPGVQQGWSTNEVGDAVWNDTAIPGTPGNWVSDGATFSTGSAGSPGGSPNGQIGIGGGTLPFGGGGFGGFNYPQNNAGTSNAPNFAGGFGGNGFTNDYNASMGGGYAPTFGTDPMMGGGYGSQLPQSGSGSLGSTMGSGSTTGGARDNQQVAGGDRVTARSGGVTMHGRTNQRPGRGYDPTGRSGMGAGIFNTQGQNQQEDYTGYEVANGQPNATGYGQPISSTFTPAPQQQAPPPPPQSGIGSFFEDFFNRSNAGPGGNMGEPFSSPPQQQTLQRAPAAMSSGLSPAEQSTSNNLPGQGGWNPSPGAIPTVGSGPQNETGRATIDPFSKPGPGGELGNPFGRVERPEMTYPGGNAPLTGNETPGGPTTFLSPQQQANANAGLPINGYANAPGPYTQEYQDYESRRDAAMPDHLKQTTNYQYHPDRNPWLSDYNRDNPFSGPVYEQQPQGGQQGNPFGAVTRPEMTYPGGGTPQPSGGWNARYIESLNGGDPSAGMVSGGGGGGVSGILPGGEQGSEMNPWPGGGNPIYRQPDGSIGHVPQPSDRNPGTYIDGGGRTGPWDNQGQQPWTNGGLPMPPPGNTVISGQGQPDGSIGGFDEWLSQNSEGRHLDGRGMIKAEQDYLKERGGNTVVSGQGQPSSDPNADPYGAGGFNPRQTGSPTGNTQTPVVGQELNPLNPNSQQPLGPWQRRDENGNIVSTCFVAGTPITTPGGESRIEDLKVGDKVIAFDHEGDIEVESDVVDVLESSSDEIYAVKVGDTVLEVTGEHPFWVEEAQDYIPVKELSGGDSVKIYGASSQSIDSIDLLVGKSAPVFNITVDQEHNYFAGGVLVHNKSMIDPNALDANGVPYGETMGTPVGQHGYKGYNRPSQPNADPYGAGPSGPPSKPGPGGNMGDPFGAGPSGGGYNPNTDPIQNNPYGNNAQAEQQALQNGVAPPPTMMGDHAQGPDGRPYGGHYGPMQNGAVPPMPEGATRTANGGWTQRIPWTNGGTVNGRPGFDTRGYIPGKGYTMS